MLKARLLNHTTALRFALGILLLGIALSAALARRQAEQNATALKTRFIGITDEMASRLVARLLTYEYGLRGAGGTVIINGHPQVGRERYAAYAATRDIYREFPGARGMGIIRRVRPEYEAQFLEAARADGWPEFEIRQLGPNAGERFVIQYVEPVAPNRAAVGLDIASEARRREAALAARTNGKATLSAPITLVQATGKKQRSFLLLEPIYLPNRPLQTAEQRESASVGWSYAPLVMDEVLADFKIGGDFSLELRDVKSRDDGAFFTSYENTPPPATAFERTLPIGIYGREWEAKVRATPAFANSLPLTKPSTVFGLGLGSSVLLGFLTFLFVNGRRRAAQLRAEQARRAAIVDSSHDAVIAETLDGIIFEWNRGAEKLFGYSAQQALGRLTADLILPAEHAAEDAAMRASVARGEQLPPFDTRRLTADGRLLDVSITVSPIHAGAEGVALSKTIRDISDAKRAEQAVRALNQSLERQVADRTLLLEGARRDLQNILDAVPSLVSYWDRELRNRFANQAYRNWFGWAPESLPGRVALELLEGRHVGGEERVRAALRGEPQLFELCIEGQGGSVRQAVAHLLPDTVDGEVRGFYAIVFDVTQQKEAQARLAGALRENEALLRTLHEYAIVSMTDRAGNITEANDHFVRISGYERREIIGRTHRLINSGVHEPAFWQKMWSTIAAGKIWRAEVCNRAKDGSLYWMDSMVAPFLGEDGQIEKYVSIRFDITARKQMAVQLERSNERMAMAAEGAGIGIWEFDVQRRAMSWDEWMHRIYGVSESRADTYALWRASVYPGDLARVEEEINEALRGRQLFDTEFRIVRPDGEVRHIRASAKVVHSEIGEVLRLTGVNFDVTERKLAELRLLETSTLLRAVLESASEVSLIATDRDLKISVFNRGAERLLGYSAEEVVNKRTPGFIHDRAEMEARVLELAALSGTPPEQINPFTHPLALRQPREWTYIRKDGSRVTVSLIIAPMLNQTGELLGFLGVAYDVTQQKAYESSLRNAMLRAEQASVAKTQFLANMSHEIRTPMNAVIGLSYLLGRTELDSEQAGLLSQISVANKSLLGLINDVLDFSKIEAGELSLERVPFVLPDLLEELLAMYLIQARTKGLRLSFELSPELPRTVLGDVMRLTQILNNLISNAIKFTARGSIGVRLTCSPLSDALALSSERAPSSAPAARKSSRVMLRFEVSDTGIGISEEAQARLFAPFVQADESTTRRFGGTGLGLSIVKRLAEMMGGSVGIQSRVNVGSTFWCAIPFDLAAEPTQRQSFPLPSSSPRTPSPRAPSPPASSRPLAGVRILVVDDSDINRYVAERILADQGASAVLASTGLQAIEHLRSAPTAYDAVLMDVQMPEMDGHHTTRIIREQLGLPDLPVIALTADARQSERLAAEASGMNDFLAKPFDPAALAACIQRHVHPSLPVPPDRLEIEDSELESGGPHNSPAWPTIEGIDMPDARMRLADDMPLFERLAKRLVASYSGLLFEPDDPDCFEALAQHAHRVRGASGQLGAKPIHQLAERLEAACRERNEELVVTLLPRLETAVQKLRRELDRAFPSASASAVAAPAPDAGELLEVLVTLLQRQDLSALDLAGKLAPSLRDLLGDAAYQQFRAHVDSLLFADAAELILAHTNERASGTMPSVPSLPGSASA